MKNYENLVDEHLEFMIRLVCAAQEDAEIDELIAESQLEHTPEEKEITRNAYLLFQRKLAEQEQKERKDSRRRRVQRILPRTISVAACLVILLAILRLADHVISNPNIINKGPCNRSISGI